MRKAMAFALTLLGTLGTLVGSASARIGELELTDGRTLFGEVNPAGSGYQYKDNSGASVMLPSSEVKNVQFFNSAQDAYKHKAAALAKGDVAGHYRLGRWAMHNDMPEQMAEQAQAVLDVAPEHPGARLLLAIYTRNKSRGPTTGPDNGNGGDNNGNDNANVTRPGEVRQLTADDVNRIRLLEWRPGRPINMIAKSGGTEKMWELIKDVDRFKVAGADRKFGQLPVHQQVSTVMDVIRPEEYYTLAQMVEVREDPEVMKAFRRIQPWLLRTCATSNCHGGTTGKVPYHLISPATSDEAIYTNFYVLSEYANANGRLINRDRAEDSLLLQFIQPENLPGGKNHPQIPQELRRLTTTRSGIYPDLIRWINALRRMPKLPYHVDYPVAGGVPGPGPGPMRPEGGEPGMAPPPDDPGRWQVPNAPPRQ